MRVLVCIAQMIGDKIMAEAVPTALILANENESCLVRVKEREQQKETGFKGYKEMEWERYTTRSASVFFPSFLFLKRRRDIHPSHRLSNLTPLVFSGPHQSLLVGTTRVKVQSLALWVVVAL